MAGWFRNFREKKRSTFMAFDNTVDLYPSISEKPLCGATDFAKLYVNISDQDSDITFHARR